MQKIITPEENYRALDEWTDGHKLFLVCDSSLPYLSGIREHLDELQNKGVSIIRFSDFQSNPLYENVLTGIEQFRTENCNAIMAIGGGSAIDVAKCIKLFSSMEGDGKGGSFLTMKAPSNNIPFLAMPTTAGTGSEATRYAVVYYNGSKQSITDNSLIPDTVLMDHSCLTTLPDYQKKSTMMDALCHAIESYWSVNSTKESRAYSDESIRQIKRYKDGYLANTEEGNRGMLMAANTAGKAINIAQTTAGHAMCYKITSLFGCAHGHAAALCVKELYPHMVANTQKCNDPRGEVYLKQVLKAISAALGGKDTTDGVDIFAALYNKLQLAIPKATEDQFAILTSSVNPVRLKNHPIAMDVETLSVLYKKILGEKHES